MLSIIVPVYNVERYIVQCLDSILSQSLTDFELLLVDDGSTDSSGDICDDYAKRDNRIRVIHIPNSGVSFARNKGLEESKGEWISFVDSDDFVESDYLERFQVGKDNADLIIQGLEYFDNRNGCFFKQVRVNNCILGGDGFKEKVAQNDLLRSGYPVAKAYRKRLLADKIRFNTNISFHEDHIFVMETMNAAKTIRLVDSVAYKYRYFHSSNTLSRKRHPWSQLNEASNGMLNCLYAMKGRFLNEGTDYCRSIFSFAYEPKLAAVYELFRTQKNSSLIKEDYQSIINRQQLKNSYYPTDKKSKLVKLVMSTMPYSFVDAFVRFVVRYQDRNKKYLSIRWE